MEVADTGVAVSPDGSALAVLDADDDEGSARMRIFDLAVGEEVVTEDGMDTSGIGDPVDHLLESEVEILGIDDEEVYARVIEGYYAYDLVSGEGREVDGRRTRRATGATRPSRRTGSGASASVTGCATWWSAAVR